MPLPAIPADFWFPELASTFDFVDEAFYLVYWICVVFFLIIVIGQAYFMVRYRRRPGHTETRTATHNYPLELSWSVIPTLLIVVIFTYGFLGFLNLRTPPANAYDINVIAKKWAWLFEYPSGVASDELHAEVGMPTRLIMSSGDVLHSLFLRDFRVKQDVVPGRYSYAWFEAIKPGEYEVQCTEYCGRNHSDMLAKVVIHEKGGLQRWINKEIEDLEKAPPLQLGEKLYNQRACVTCHSLDGARRVGPSFNQTYGNEHEFTDGTKARGDENYIRESIINPQAQVRAGYPASMPTYKGQLSDNALRGLVTFIKAQNPKFKKQAEEDSAAVEREIKAKAAAGGAAPAGSAPADPAPADPAAAGGGGAGAM